MLSRYTGSRKRIWLLHKHAFTDVAPALVHSRVHTPTLPTWKAVALTATEGDLGLHTHVTSGFC